MTLPERLRKRLALLILAAGAAATAYVILPRVPREHQVDLRLDDAASVTAVEVAWAPLGAGSPAEPAGKPETAEAVRGTAWHFQPGSAPGTVGATVSVPDGRYALDVVVERGVGVESFHRVLTLGDADHISVTLHRDAR
jgi:hypothetical protein